MKKIKKIQFFLLPLFCEVRQRNAGQLTAKLLLFCTVLLAYGCAKDDIEGDENENALKYNYLAIVDDNASNLYEEYQTSNTMR